MQSIPEYFVRSNVFLKHRTNWDNVRWCSRGFTEGWHGRYQNYTTRIFILPKISKNAINNLAYNEHTNTCFKCNKILNLSDQCKLQVSNYIFKLVHSNIDEEIESSLFVYNQINSHNIKSNNQSNLPFNRSKTNCCLPQWYYDMEFSSRCIKSHISFSMFKSKVQNLYLEKY